MDLVTLRRLQGGFDILQSVKVVEVIESEERLRVLVSSEIQSGKRGPFPTQTAQYFSITLPKLRNAVSYCDSEHSMSGISEACGRLVLELSNITQERRAADCSE